MKVGIFDSGIGGLSVLYQAKKMLPNVRFLYYADEKHVPYGEKTTEQIQGYVKEALNFLIQQEVDAVIIACNTATSVASQEFRSHFPVPIVGMEPAVKKAVALHQERDKRILVAATPVTIAGPKLHLLVERVDTEHRVDLVALPGLVRLAEKGIFYGPQAESYLREALAGFCLERYEALVLGCTHFNYFKETFRQIFPAEIKFVDGNAGTIRQLLHVLPQQEVVDKESDVIYYYSGEEVGEKEKKRLQSCIMQLERVWSL